MNKLLLIALVSTLGWACGRAENAETIRSESIAFSISHPGSLTAVSANRS